MRKTQLIILIFITVVIASLIFYAKQLKEDTQPNGQINTILSSISPWDISQIKTIKQQEEMSRQESDRYNGFVRIPFTSIGSGKDPELGEVYINKIYESKFIGPNLNISFPFPGVPIDLQVVNGKYKFAFRKIFEGELFQLSYDSSGQLEREEIIQIDGIDFPIFRASAVVEDTLYWVVYDNRMQRNYLIDVESFPEASGLMVELPTLYPPAGGTYEMEPPVFFAGDDEGGFQLVAGALYAKIINGKVESHRLVGCETVIEALFTHDKPVVLCRASKGMSSPYLLSVPEDGGENEQQEYLSMDEGIPWGLYVEEDGTFQVKRAKTHQEVLEVFLWDLHGNQQGGVLEFGINNIEGRIPWSQIYYLNGLMDLLLLIELHQTANATFGVISNDLIARVTLEVESLDDLLDNEYGYYTKGFTYDRSSTLFAVQTSRLLLLFDRYEEEFPEAPRLNNTEKLRKMVVELDGHIEELAYEGEEDVWMKKDTAHLRWPKCSAFYFDGMAVPFNHQNEWAYSLFNTARIKRHSIDALNLNSSRDIIEFFMEKLGNKGGFPTTESWYYWYGHAYDGWTEEEKLSCNMPTYSGDQGLAWISFRTIDFMSVMSALDYRG